MEKTLHYQEFVEIANAFENWMNQEHQVLEKFSVSNDLAVIEAQKIQHDEHGKSINAKSADLEKVIQMGEKVEDRKEDVESRVADLKEKYEALGKFWTQVLNQILEGDKLARFERDCARAEHWMNIREQALNAQDNNQQNVEVLMKKHEDFDRALKLQESKINAIVTEADNLIEADHSSKEKIASRKEEILQRWNGLKEQLTAKHKEVGEVQTLQEFWKTSEEYDEWLDEKIVVAKQPINEQHLNQGIQRHQAFQSELDANQDRLDSILKAGEDISQKNEDQAHLIKEKSDALMSKKNNLDELCKTKSKLYDDAQMAREFLAGCKALEYWLAETKAKVEQMDGKDQKSAVNQLKSLNQIKEEYQIKCEILEELKTKIKDQEASSTQNELMTTLVTSFDEVLVLISGKQQHLESILARFELVTKLNEQIHWVQEKIIFAKKEETGSDLAQAESFSTKHKRLCHEVESKASFILDGGI